MHHIVRYKYMDHIYCSLAAFISLHDSVLSESYFKIKTKNPGFCRRGKKNDHP